MARSTRLFVGVILPLFTLLIGWQMGVRYTTVQYNETQRHLEELLVGTSQSGSLVTDPAQDVNIELLWTTWKILLTHYLRPEELNTQTMVEGAVAGMVEAVGDPYTLFMTSDENQEFIDGLDGNLEGIGAELTVKEGIVQIVRLIHDSPAERAGLLPEDIITHVDDIDITGLPLSDVISHIRGPKGTTVHIRIIRTKTDGDDTLEIAIQRAKIHIPSAEYEEKSGTGGTVGVLTISQFGSSTIHEVQTILTKIDAATLKGLIIDLRYNGGGYLEGAIDLTSMFVPEGRVVTVASREERTHHDVTGSTVLPTIPLVVLINEGSASASEIFAGAVQDHDRATIIGTQSYGKGTVQEVIDLPGNTSLRVTVATWLTPDGTDLGKHGVTPDSIVKRTTDDLEAKRDPQLEAAMRELREL